MNQGFDELGYAVFAPPFAPTVIENIRHEADDIRDKLIEQMAAGKTPDPRVTWWRLDDGAAYLLKIKPVVNLAPAAAALAHGFWARATLGELLDNTPYLMEDKFMYKQRLMSDVDWVDLPLLGEEVRKHTDAAYFQARGFERVITVAVCLDDCTAESGALKVWPGTHRRSVAMSHTSRQGPVVADEDAPDEDGVVLTAPVGSVLVWDSALVHASGPNLSGRPRRLLVLGYTASRVGW
ncbi:hypothetical protein Rhe02_13170 [Rhizocola hellebori]|uniref:Phytanoyl-CoA dioxygenase family protein n=1 Tax=Rhizocola hellebori TaxID=1392758 RepID=A0A8J3VE40_9ACTN|nr:phytanoyl-CoA dioxygenase family protein [Rhizocola hellebori]GIH03250.1 hypothetical protein Rhe02_13170 [Rhizocola hellebori]